MFQPLVRDLIVAKAKSLQVRQLRDRPKAGISNMRVTKQQRAEISKASSHVTLRFIVALSCPLEFAQAHEVR